MKTKFCGFCQVEGDILFRIQIQKGKTWIFVCQSCCKNVQTLEYYKYGGTWKGKRH